MDRIAVPWEELTARVHDLWEGQGLLLTVGDFRAGSFNTMTVGWGSLARIIHEFERQEGPRVLEKQCSSGFSHKRRPSGAPSDYDAVCPLSRAF
jgi:hypothetical protein